MAGIAGVTGVVAAFGKAIGRAAERETAAQRSGAVADGCGDLAGTMGKLEAASKATGTDFPQLAKGVQNLKKAGLSLGDATIASTKLNEIAFADPELSFRSAWTRLQKEAPELFAGWIKKAGRFGAALCPTK